MPNAEANGIQIEYETFGDRSSRPLLLIMGLGGQMIFWDEEVCEKLVEKGHYVIRFDNRDVGLSTKLEEAGIPDVIEALQDSLKGKRVQAPYTLDDMADDSVGLLDALGIEKAHVCGVSMGAMITQAIGIRHPSRILSLIPIYGSTGNPELPRPKPEITEMLLTAPPTEREAYIEHRVKRLRMFAGPGFPFDEEWARKKGGESFDRNFYPEGIARQYVAVLTHGNRKPALASVTAPTLVVHGEDDPLVPVEGGKDTAEAIPGAELLIIEGMGHDLPHGGAWPRIIDAISAHTKKAEA